jgi:hypothetical protein
MPPLTHEQLQRLGCEAWCAYWRAINPGSPELYCHAEFLKQNLTMQIIWREVALAVVESHNKDLSLP